MKIKRKLPLKATPSKKYLLVWVVAIYTGSVLAQFGGFSDLSMLAIWGLLFSTVITITHSLKNHLTSKMQSYHNILVLCMGFTFLFSLLYLVLPQMTQLLQPSFVYALWHLVMTMGYATIVKIFKDTTLLISLLISLLTLSLYLIPQFMDLYPLIFGLIQAPLLLVIGYIYLHD